jgi:hypothetical protein
MQRRITKCDAVPLKSFAGKGGQNCSSETVSDGSPSIDGSSIAKMLKRWLGWTPAKSASWQIRQRTKWNDSRHRRWYDLTAAMGIIRTGRRHQKYIVSGWEERK